MWDQDLFLWLNFDGGATMDSIMLFASGKTSWIPLYLLILGLVWRKDGWRSAILLAVTIGLAVGMSDLVAGIFKHTGPLKHLWEDFPARLRPMHTPDLERVIHFINKGALYGTVSAHAATSLAIGLISSFAIKRWWFYIVMAIQVLLVCYSRIYLGYHFPQDILLGLSIGTLSGYLMYQIYKVLNKKIRRQNGQ